MRKLEWLAYAKLYLPISVGSSERVCTRERYNFLIIETNDRVRTDCKLPRVTMTLPHAIEDLRLVVSTEIRNIETECTLTCRR